MRRASSFRAKTLPVVLLGGDAVATVGGLLAGFWLRYHTVLNDWLVDVPNARLGPYLSLLGLGALFLLASFAHLGAYDERLLLRPGAGVRLVLKGTAFWLCAYLGLSLVLRFDPPISRAFVLLSAGAVLMAVLAWRHLFTRLVRHPRWLPAVQQRAALLGWSPLAAELAAELAPSRAQPLAIIGVVRFPDDPPPPPPLADLGPVSRLDDLLSGGGIEVLISARPTDEVGLEVASACERHYVERKVIPGAGTVFLSGLRLQTIGRVPLLGVEDLALTRLFNRIIKRAIDLVGAALGLLLTFPLLLWFGWRVRRESPGAPALFRQVRIGAGHRPFEMLKLRSMAPGAERRDHERLSTRPDDDRLTPVGRTLRRWNIDELPQLWNVLRGDMSLVGPRPERPHHVENLSRRIPHYLPRHVAKPGLTGWAQVNGLRGDTSLESRIQHDLFYIENWSIWLDLQILALTVLRLHEGGSAPASPAEPAGPSASTARPLAEPSAPPRR